MTKTENESYNAADIEVLEGLEPVRKRPGMYIGGVDSTALHHLSVEIIDNAMDEAIAGHAKKIQIEAMNFKKQQEISNVLTLPPGKIFLIF